jgi:hypothetical protein
MAGLTKQHFESIAKIIKGNVEYFSNSVGEGYKLKNIDSLITDLSNYFKTQNPLFNENQFKKACLE